MLVSLKRCTCWFLARSSKRCRIHLSKRHRFAIANFNSCASVSTADCDDITTDVIIADPALVLLCQLLIVMTSLLIQLLRFLSTADCDDITADVIIADSR
ncbi:zinc finger family protein [Dorcoceras hygrometricum]|uniref:Zinc finger family protein n=1 Tax=Dorcoceras hygrometricum TaxID=472368 RepID=A0A2Z7AFL9_9LAMI|nr:zinc finger family protein [Dorcoceras hygrometricum]